MHGRSLLTALASLVLASGSSTRTASMPRAFALPYGRLHAWIAPSYPRKDRMSTAAQHKRASKKARKVAKHKRHA